MQELSNHLFGNCHYGGRCGYVDQVYGRKISGTIIGVQLPLQVRQQLQSLYCGRDLCLSLGHQPMAFAQIMMKWRLMKNVHRCRHDLGTNQSGSYRYIEPVVYCQMIPILINLVVQIDLDPSTPGHSNQFLQLLWKLVVNTSTGRVNIYSNYRF